MSKRKAVSSQKEISSFFKKRCSEADSSNSSSRVEETAGILSPILEDANPAPEVSASSSQDLPTAVISSKEVTETRDLSKKGQPPKQPLIVFPTKNDNRRFSRYWYK